MNWFSTAVAVLGAVAIMAIGGMYLTVPTRMSHSFGLPLPGDNPNIPSWLRLKGTRDVVSGLVLLALVAWGEPGVLGYVMLILALTPLGDMTTVLSAKGSVRTAFLVHGLTAATLVAGAIPLLPGKA